MDDFFCLDLGEANIKISEIRSMGNLFQADNLSMIPIDPLFYRAESESTIKKTASALSTALDQLRIKKNTVRVIIPDSFSYNRFIKMPRLNEKELLSAVRYQADQFIPMPLDEINLDIEVVHENQTTNETLVLLSASPKKTIDKVKRTLEYIGILPQSIEPETSAIGRFLSEIYKKEKKAEQKKEGFILINLNLSSTSIYYFDSALQLMTHSNNFNTGYSLFIKEIQVNLNVDSKKSMELLNSFGLSQNASFHLDTILAPSLKDFISKIDRSIKEITNINKSPISHIYLTNEAVRFNSLDTIVGKFFGVPASFFDLSQYFAKNKVVDFFKNNLTYFMASAGASLS